MLEYFISVYVSRYIDFQNGKVKITSHLLEKLFRLLAKRAIGFRIKGDLQTHVRTDVQFVASPSGQHSLWNSDSATCFNFGNPMISSSNMGILKTGNWNSSLAISR